MAWRLGADWPAGIGVGVEAGEIPALIFDPATASDHGGIVGTEGEIGPADNRAIGFWPVMINEGGQAVTERAVGGDTSRNHDRARMGFASGGNGFGGEDIDDGLFERSGQVGYR